AGDAGDEDEHEHRHAGHPAEPAYAAIPVEGELPQEVCGHHDNESVGSIAVQAAHDARRVPLIMRHVFDGSEGVVNAGLEKDEQVDAADRNDPVEKEAERAEIEQRIPLGRKSLVQSSLGQVEAPPDGSAQKIHRGRPTPPADERRHSRINATAIRLKLASPMPMLMNSE